MTRLGRTRLPALPEWVWIVAACVTFGAVIGAATTVVNPLLLLAAAPLLPIGAWMLRKAETGLLMTIFVIALLPRVSSPISIGFKPTLLDGTLIALLLGWLLWRGKHTPSVRHAVELPLIGLVFVCISTFILGAPNGAITTLVLRRFAELLLSLLFVFVFVSVLREPGRLTQVTRWMLLLGGASATLALALYVMPDALATSLLSQLRPFGYPSGPDVLRFIRDDPALMQRATGLWIDPNAFGGYLLLMTSLGLPQLFASPTARVLPRKWAWLCVGTMALALILTVSRSAMLGVAVAAFVVGVLRHRSLLWLGLLGARALLILPQTRELINHFLEGFAGQDLSTQMRFGEYKDALKLIERYPLLGVGFIDTPDNDLYIGVSSMYLLILSQMGILGMLAFGSTMLLHFVTALREWFAEQNMHSTARGEVFLGAHAAVAAALFCGIFDHYFFNIDFHNSVALFWLMVAIGLAARGVAVGSPVVAQWSKP